MYRRYVYIYVYIYIYSWCCPIDVMHPPGQHKDLGSCNGTCLRLSAERQESGWHPIMDGDAAGPNVGRDVGTEILIGDNRYNYDMYIYIYDYSYIYTYIHVYI